jgi:hypothetical protein
MLACLCLLLYSTISQGSNEPSSSCRNPVPCVAAPDSGSESLLESDTESLPEGALWQWLVRKIIF